MDISKFIEIAQPLGALGVKVTQKDELTAQWYLEGECRRNIYSASKSYVSCAVGFAVQEGLLSLDEKLADVFREELPAEVSDHLAKASVRDLLTMCLGQEQGNLMGEQRPVYEEKNWVKLSLEIPFVYEPGTHFVYNNVGPYLAGILVQKRAGCDLVSYLMPRLFEPMGIHRPTWEVDPLGNTFGAGGLFLTLTELHKFGLFYLREGEWNGRQLLLADWIRESTKCQAVGEDYGYLFWRGEYNSFRADGKYSQLSIILPDKDAVVTVVSECRRGDDAGNLRSCVCAAVRAGDIAVINNFQNLDSSIFPRMATIIITTLKSGERRWIQNEKIQNKCVRYKKIISAGFSSSHDFFHACYGEGGRSACGRLSG